MVKKVYEFTFFIGFLSIGFTFFFPTRFISLVPEYAIGESLEATVSDFVPIRDVEETEVEDFATSTIYFIGDIMLGRHVEYLIDKYGLDYPYQQLSFLTEEPAYTYANFEAAVPAEHIKTPNFGYVFSVATNTLPYLRQAGVTNVSLANNHAADFGLSNLINAKNELSKVGIESFGLPSMLSTSSVSVSEIHGYTVGVVALNTLFASPTDTDLREILTTLSNETDLQVIFIHWGDEYKRTAGMKERLLARKLVDLGADLIVGHHPHVVQEIEKIDNTLVFYSLGNFIFDQYFSRDVREGLVLKLRVDGNGGLYLRLMPISSLENKAQPRLMEREEKSVFLKELAKLSDEKLASEILAGEFDLTLKLATSSKNAIMDQ